MKIAMICSSVSRKGGGVAAVVEELSRAVSSSGCEVRVFSLADNEWTASASKDWRGADVEVFRIFGPQSFGYAPNMLSAIKSWGPDLVHLHGLWMHPSRSVLKWSEATMKPFIISPHGMLSSQALSYSPLKKKIVSEWFQNACFKNSCAIHVTCEAERIETRDYGLKQPKILVPNGVTVPKRIASYPANGVGGVVLSLGRIHPKKNLADLIRAWAYLEDHFPEWDLKLVGPDENGHSYQLNKLISFLGLKRVSIKKPVHGKEKDELMSSAELFVLPTLSENFAMTVAESLANGTPVISTKGAPWSGLTTYRCGWWVEHGVEELVRTMRAAMTLDQSERREMGQRGRLWMQSEFSWSSIGKRVKLAYEWALSPNSTLPSFISGSKDPVFSRNLD